MSWLFGKKKTPQGIFLRCFTCAVPKHVIAYQNCCLRITELLRENKRMLDKAIRELDRERMALQNQEKKVIAEIKKTAKQGQMVVHIVKLQLQAQLAKQLAPTVTSSCCL